VAEVVHRPASSRSAGVAGQGPRVTRKPCTSHKRDRGDASDNALGRTESESQEVFPTRFCKPVDRWCGWYLDGPYRQRVAVFGLS